MDEEIVVKEARIEDSLQIYNLWKKLSYDHFEKDEYLDHEINIDHVSQQMYEEIIKNPNCKIFVAFDGENIIGYIETWIKEPGDDFYIDKYAYILHCYIDKEHRGLKIANKLHYAMENFVKEEGIKYIHADVYEHNKKFKNALRYHGLQTYRTRLIKQIN